MATSTGLPATAACNRGCAEPMIHSSPDGSLYVSAPRSLLVCCNGRPSPIWRSTDGGESWSEPFAPSSPQGAWNALTGGDTALVVDKRGSLYVSELWLGNDALFISHDGGETWNSTPAHHPDAYTDREWLVYSEPEDAIYGIYNAPGGLRIVKAHLGGDDPLLWTDWQVEPFEHSGHVPIPAVDQTDGTIYVPFSSPTQAEPSALGVAVSTDQGETWTRRFIPTSPPGGTDVQNIFLVSAVDAEGTVYIAWSAEETDGHTVFYASSADQGRTWNPPVPVSDALHATAVFPAITAGAAGRVAVAWYGTNGAIGDPDLFPDDTTWDVGAASVLRADTDAPTIHAAMVEADHHRGSMWLADNVNGGGDRTLLDFFDLELDPISGRIVVVYSRDFEDRVEIASVIQSAGCSLLRAGEVIGTSPSTDC